MEDLTYKVERPQEEYESSDLNSDSGDSSFRDACVSCIDETMFPPRQKLPESAVIKLSTLARKLAMATLFCNIVITAFGFFTSTESDSMATFGFAFDSFFAVISSVVLIWRFWTDNPDSYVVAKRETNATAVIAVCLVVSSIAITGRSINCLFDTDKPGKPAELIILTSASLFAYSVLFLIKRVIAVKLGSGALMTDAMDSLCGALFALSILISALVLEFTEKAWFMDSTIAIVVSVCSFVYGVIVLQKLICVHLKREEKAMKKEQGYDLLQQEQTAEE
ncbi:transmembrane protein 163-like [Dendronephthya gigantea]|uniref:transmembrane protein 163-like n=1 Tax=Dendronephthya gigantea TaxID=151771 RepID=UPI00106C67A6|nr:transmembrane protein 163-like [Dendronephthya gigantea]